jgi:hypothetical protein
MKTKELEQALRLITKALADPRVGPGQGDLLRKAKRQLESTARSGKVEHQKIFRAIELISVVLLEVVKNEATQRSE